MVPLALQPVNVACQFMPYAEPLWPAAVERICELWHRFVSVHFLPNRHGMFATVAQARLRECRFGARFVALWG